MDERAIIAGLKNGENAAYQRLFELHYQALCHFAIGLLRDRFEAESAVNDVFFAIWRNRDQIDIRSLRAYLLRAVRNRCLNRAEQQRRQHELADELTTLHAANPASATYAPSPLEHFLEKELDLRVSSLLDDMPEPTGSIFRLSRFKQMKYHEIAEHTGLSMDVVKYHIKRALSRLRAGLRDYLD